MAALLLRLRQALPPPPPSKSKKSAAPHLQLEWTVRQRRSKSTPRHISSAERKAELTRASPTTPLSWSGATSASGGGAADCYEESSRLTKQMQSSRSEVRCNFPAPLYTYFLKTENLRSAILPVIVLRQPASLTHFVSVSQLHNKGATRAEASLCLTVFNFFS